jgi:hypothetical protein
MPSIVPPVPLQRWQRPSKTEENLPWAQIQVIDLSTFEAPGRKLELAEQLRDAVSERVLSARNKY